MIAACVVGDGEAETGPLAASWQLNKIINPLTDGIVLPILHLNGFKIANPTILARMPEDELVKYFEGCGWTPYIVEASTTDKIHELMAKTLDKCISDIKITAQSNHNKLNVLLTNLKSNQELSFSSSVKEGEKWVSLIRRNSS